MLTMDTEKANITGLTLTPCVAAPVKKAAPKRALQRRKAGLGAALQRRACLFRPGRSRIRQNQAEPKRSTGLREAPAPFRSWK